MSEAKAAMRCGEVCVIGFAGQVVQRCGDSEASWVLARQEAARLNEIRPVQLPAQVEQDADASAEAWRIQ